MRQRGRQLERQGERRENQDERIEERGEDLKNRGRRLRRRASRRNLTPEQRQARKARRKSQRKFAKQDFETKTGKSYKDAPKPLKSEMVRHARTRARLNRLKEVSGQKEGESRTKLLARIQKLETKENDKHAQRLETISNNGSGASDTVPATEGSK